MCGAFCIIGAVLGGRFARGGRNLQKSEEQSEKNRCKKTRDPAGGRETEEEMSIGKNPKRRNETKHHASRLYLGVEAGAGVARGMGGMRRVGGGAEPPEQGQLPGMPVTVYWSVKYWHPLIFVYIGAESLSCAQSEMEGALAPCCVSV